MAGLHRRVARRSSYSRSGWRLLAFSCIAAAYCYFNIHHYDAIAQNYQRDDAYYYSSANSNDDYYDSSSTTSGSTQNHKSICHHLEQSISRAAKDDAASSSIPSIIFPPKGWAESPSSRKPMHDTNYTSVSSIMNNQSLDLPFELGQPISNKSIPTLPFFENATKFHPCCASFLHHATSGEQTFQNVEFDIADFFRTMGNKSRLLMAGDSIARGSAQSALCSLVAAGADFYYVEWDHDANEELQNKTRENGGHAPSICGTWFRGWQSRHYFTLPHPSHVDDARIPLEGTLLPSEMVGRTFHQLNWLSEIRGAMNIPEQQQQQQDEQYTTALLLNFGIWWNLGEASNLNLNKLEDDSPSKLYEQLLLQFEKLATSHHHHSNNNNNPPIIVFWRESTPQLFPSFEVVDDTGNDVKCANYPDLYVGGSYPGGGCAKGVHNAWDAGSCQRNNSQSLGWNRASPYRWRQRLAVSAAQKAGLRIVQPPVMAHSTGDDRSSVSPLNVSGEVLWLPFHDAALQYRQVYNEKGDCTHPDPFRRAFWSVLWDGMARHVIERQCRAYRLL